MTTSPEQEILQRLAEMSHTNADDWFVVSRARHGMAVVLRVLAQQYGTGEVITQAFTCVTAVNPILDARLTPIYAEISRDNLSIDTQLLPKLINPSTRCIVAQHTLGLNADIATMRTMIVASKNNILLMEDSAHCLGKIARSDDTPLADIAIHSFGAEKVLKTIAGGAIWLNPAMPDQELYTKLRTAFEALPTMGRAETLRYLAYPYLNAIMNRLPKVLRAPLRRGLQALRIFLTPVMPKEQSGNMDGRPSRLPVALAKNVLSELTNLDVNLARRSDNVALYDKLLAAKLEKYPHQPEASLVRYPVRAATSDQAERLFHELRAKGYTIGKWYRPLFFPGVSDLSLYGYHQGQCPVAEDESARIVNLPTNLGNQTARNLIDELNR